ncbi:sec-independent protein translocase protein TatB [Brucella endophytica]|uniref:Sec-independent protein translocase protein TatB n=1 Tax=Brucella endophytica TaxID=1963359 RepID=A0A916WCA8_9HYPH|nr:Sec-independent protein translocase protein TatB [Brucella endophytica]GGA84828.1 sec-independent protein translocase protein TatB [Brucella endophytica]
MLDVGWSEILVIMIVIIVVVGPKDLPKMLRAFGKATARMRSTADQFRRQFDEALREAELEDVKNVVEDARRLDPRTDIKKMFDPIRSAGEELRQSLHGPVTETTPAQDIVTLVPPPPPEPITSAPAPAPVEAAPAVAANTPVAAPPAVTSTVPAGTPSVEPAATKKPVRAARKTAAPRAATSSARKTAEPASKPAKPRTARTPKAKADETKA